MEENSQDCQVCYRIICRGCGWVASDEAIRCIQRGEMTVCPECGWSPKGNNPITQSLK